MKQVGSIVICILMLLALAGSMAPCDTNCQDDDCAATCVCQTCTVAIVQADVQVTSDLAVSLLPPHTPLAPCFSYCTSIFRPPIA